MDTNKDVLQQFAALAKQQVDKAAAESVERIQQQNRNRNRERYGCDCGLAVCYTTCPRYLTYAEPEVLFRWWSMTSPPDGRFKEALLTMPAPPQKKGGSRSRKRKKPAKFFVNPYIIG